MSWQAWALLSALFAGLTAVLAKAGVTGVGSSLATAIRTAFALVLTWGAALAVGEVAGLAGVSARTWWLLALSGAATAMSWRCYFRAMQAGPASKVAPVDKLSVFFDAAFLDEALTARTLIGAGLILAGAWVLAG